MTEYIERDALLDDISAAVKHRGMGEIIGQTLMRYVKRQPAADVAPVVRCENCAFSQSNGWVCGGTALMPQHRTFPNSFCSDGERREDA